MSRLAQKKCTPCTGDIPPLDEDVVLNLLVELEDTWSVIDNHHLRRTFRFEDFQSALEFTVKVGELAEQEGHHPDIHLAWGKVCLEIWTHKIDGLTESDFVLAAKCEALAP